MPCYLLSMYNDLANYQRANYACDASNLKPAWDMLRTAVRLGRRTNHNGFPVLMRGTRKFVGTILRSQLIVLLKVGTGYQYGCTCVFTKQALMMRSPCLCNTSSRAAASVLWRAWYAPATIPLPTHSLTIKRIRSAIDD